MFVFQCWFIIRRGCSCSLLKGRARDETEALVPWFSCHHRQTRQVPRLGVCREGANGCLWSQMPPLRMVGLQQHLA